MGWKLQHCDALEIASDSAVRRDCLCVPHLQLSTRMDCGWSVLEVPLGDRSRDIVTKRLC